MNISRISSTVERMNRKLLIGQVLLVVMLSLGTSSQGNTGLICHSDYIDVITCDWNRSSAENRFLITPATNCCLHADFKGASRREICQGVLMPVGSPQQKLYQATLKFSHKALNFGSSTLPLKVLCENITEPVEYIDSFNPSFYIKLYPPEKPVVNGQNVTWKLGSPVPLFLKSWLFEVQWKQRKSSWESKSTRTYTNVQEMFYRLDESMLILGEEYEIRVRSTYRNSIMIWSEWSSVTEWTSTVGNPPSTRKPEVFNQMFLDNFSGLTGLFIFIAAAVFAVTFFSIRRSLSLKSLLKPKPSEYFNQLFTDGGDFKCPSAIPKLYLNPESEDVSPVEVDKCLGFDPLLRKPEKGDNQRDNSNSMTSCFSNSTYFLSQSSKCAVSDQLQPCSTDCPYGPAGGTGEEEKRALVSPDNKDEPESSASSPVEPSPSCDDLHKLRIDVQSPDSGFAAGTDDQESQDESGSEGLPSPPVMDNVLPMNRILPCPVPQLSNIPHPLLPPSFPWSPWNSLAFPTLAPGFSTTVPFGNSKLQACSGMVEPSDDGYKPVTKMQE